MTFFYGNRVAYRLSTRYATLLIIHHPLRVLRGFAGDFVAVGLVTGLFSRIPASVWVDRTEEQKYRS